MLATTGAAAAHGQTTSPASTGAGGEGSQATTRAASGGLDSESSEPSAEEKTATSTRDQGGKLRLLRSDARPSKAWFAGRPARFRFEIGGKRKRDVVVLVKRKGDEPKVVRRYQVAGVPPGEPQAIKWNGRVDGGGKYARQGRYKFRVRPAAGGKVDSDQAEGRRKAGFYKHKFPVRGRHSYGDGLGAGRGHRGADVFAKCGTRLQAARAGRVKLKAYQGSGAGHYLVIEGRGNGKDYVYMHLKRASRLSEGERVRTGQKIGLVGESGNARGCHLHFEVWSSPGWYEGGDFTDAMAKLRRWDRWS